MDNKNYEDKINEIKNYLKQKEKEVDDNKVNKYNDYLKFDDDIYIKKDSFDNNSNKDNNIKISSTDNINKKNDIKKEVIKNKKNILNIILIILLILEPLFITLSYISINTTYLISKPFNYIFYALSGISFIWIICLIILNYLDGKKIFKKQCIIASIITIILNIIFMIICISTKIWSNLDIFLENKKLILILIFILILTLVIIMIIRKKKHKKIKENIKKIILAVLMTLYIVCYFDLLTILYVPKEFKEWLITTAMQTMNHQYFCKWFYSEDDIDYVMSQNYVEESGESTDKSLIKKQVEEEQVIYENEYEEAVLKKEHKDDLYKIIELEVNGCHGYLAAIYDPTTVHVAVTNKVGKYGQYVTDMAKDRGAVLAINGGGFLDPGNTSTGGYPTGITIVDGKIVTNGEYGWNVQSGGIIGFDSDGILHLLKNTSAQEALDMGITDAISWGPFLIVNGKPSFIKGNGGWGYAARTAIGQREDGIVLLLTVDSNTTRTKGADMVDLTEIMQNYGAINAANLDGGTSTVMVMPKETALKYNPNCKDDYCLINDPIDGALRHMTRAIADAIVVVPNE